MSRKLGEGELGEVWYAYDRDRDAPVALKLLRDSFSDLHTAILKRETERNRTLDHPHLLKVHEFVYPDGKQPAISMEYASSGSVGDLLTGERTFFEVREIEGWIRQCCEALRFLHEECEIVHRGLRANNLMLDANHQIKLADFGLSARVAIELDEETQELIGDPAALHHSSPQLVAFPYDCAPRDDLFALGVTVFYLLTGTFPFRNPKEDRWSWDPENLLSMSERREVVGIEGEPIPHRWNLAVARCLAEDPEDRPVSVGDFAALLSEPEEEAETSRETVILLPIDPPDSTPTVALPRSPRAKLAWLAATFVALGLLTGVLLGLGQIWKERAGADRQRVGFAPDPMLSTLSE